MGPGTLYINMGNFLLLNGSEIPKPTTFWMYKSLYINDVISTTFPSTGEFTGILMKAKSGIYRHNRMLPRYPHNMFRISGFSRSLTCSKYMSSWGCKGAGFYASWVGHPVDPNKTHGPTGLLLASYTAVNDYLDFKEYHPAFPTFDRNLHLQ